LDDWRGNFADIYETKQVPERASIYVCNPTKTDQSLAPAGHETVFILVPLPAGVSLDDTAEEKLVDRVIGMLADMADAPDIAERIVSRKTHGPEYFKDMYNAWQSNAFGGESHLLFQSVVFRTSNKSRKVKNLYYVGAGTLPGIGLPMCLIGAQMTYKQIVGSKRAGPLDKDLL
ncbi:hypothetical protein B7Z28_02270, partial [Candidatus Saccharibacteria bacterium 32-45-3]